VYKYSYIQNFFSEQKYFTDALLESKDILIQFIWKP